MDVDDSTMVKGPVVLPKTAPEVLVSEALKEASLQESSPSKMYKDTSPSAGSEKPTTEDVEVVPSSAPTPFKENVVVDAEVIITRTRQGDPPTQNVLAKVLDDKRQVVSRPYGSIN